MLKKVKKTSLVDKVVEQIEGSILSGEFQPGDKLPASRKLQAIVGTSLGTIREAMAMLEQKGLIEVKKGAKGGVFVREISTEPVSESLALLIRHMRISPRDLAEFRQTAEAGLIRLVIERASDEEVAELVEYRDRYKGCLNHREQDWKDFLIIETQCRRRLITLARNKTYEAVLLPIHNNLFGYATQLISGNDKIVRDAYDDWMKLLSAIENRDADLAEQVTKDHIYRFQLHLEDGRPDMLLFQTE